MPSLRFPQKQSLQEMFPENKNKGLGKSETEQKEKPYTRCSTKVTIVGNGGPLYLNFPRDLQGYSNCLSKIEDAALLAWLSGWTWAYELGGHNAILG